MKSNSFDSRRDFVKKAALAAGSLGLLSGDWQRLSARQALENTVRPLGGQESKIRHLPLQALGLKDIPAVPFVIETIPDTLFRLGARSYEVLQAKIGLSNRVNIQGQNATAFSYMYGQSSPSDVLSSDVQALETLLNSTSIDALLEPAFINDLLLRFGRTTVSLGDDSLTRLSMDDPRQFALSWTNFYNIYAKATATVLPKWTATIKDARAATEAFWPTISKYGLAYNLLLLKKIDQQGLLGLKDKYDLPGFSKLLKLVSQGDLYAIDLSLFNTLDVEDVEGSPRFTPATVTLLQQDPATKKLTPFTIVVTGKNGAGSQTYLNGACTDGAWLYALQAAKASVTVYGIWIGHVYHWHIVTAAMAMTMYNNLPSDAPLFKLLDTPSRYVIEFNEVLLLLWRSIAPPSSITSGWELLQLLNRYSQGRNFFDDDPGTTLDRFGITQADFTAGSPPWNRYPIAGQLLDIWSSTNNYVKTFVDITYASDAAVAMDSSLQAWMAAAGSADEGNVRGLPTMNSKDALTRVLTSYLYRISAHGGSRLIDTANPSLTFVANFPPCLQKKEIPLPSASISTKQLLEYLPKTGTIGEMISFYFIFSFSAPYDSLIPATGIDTAFLFPNGTNDPRNQALMRFRSDIELFIKNFTVNARLPGYPQSPQYQQWPLNVET